VVAERGSKNGGSFNARRVLNGFLKIVNRDNKRIKYIHVIGRVVYRR
jgi:hypothetical protein